jgi:hypothetical protein
MGTDDLRNNQQDEETPARPALSVVRHLHLDAPGGRTGDTESELPEGSFGRAGAAKRYVFRPPVEDDQAALEQPTEDVQVDAVPEPALTPEPQEAAAGIEAVGEGRGEQGAVAVIGYRQPAPVPEPRKRAQRAPRATRPPTDDSAGARRRLLPLIGIGTLVALAGAGAAIAAGGGSAPHKAVTHHNSQRVQTVVQTVTTPVTVTQTTAAKTTTTPKHHVKKHRIVRHKTTKPKTTVTTSATASHVTTSQSTYTAPAYTAPAYTQTTQPSRSVSSESGSATTGSSTSKSSSSSKSSSTGGSLSAGQQAALNPS